jgi:hypothetical protein
MSWDIIIIGKDQEKWRDMRDSDENYLYSIALHDPAK